MNGDMCAYFGLNTSTRRYGDIACGRLWEYTHTHEYCLFVCLFPPKNGEIAQWPNMRVVKCKYYFSQKKKMGSIIRCSGTVFYSL